MNQCKLLTTARGSDVLMPGSSPTLLSEPLVDIRPCRWRFQPPKGRSWRVMIAMALSCRPKLLIADEPTTALDVTIQAQVLNIIREQQRLMGMSLISSRTTRGSLRRYRDDVVVMRTGTKVEEGSVRQIFSIPSHPYTQALLAAVPRLGSMADNPLPVRPQRQVSADGPRFQDTVDRSHAAPTSAKRASSSNTAALKSPAAAHSQPSHRVPGRNPC